MYEGYRRACPDFQRMPSSVKWGRKLSAWGQRYFAPENVAAWSHEDWTTLCKILVTASSWTGCAAATLSCGASEVMTFGGVTIPCYVILLAICGGHGAVGQSLLFDRCGMLMGAR